MTDRPAPAREEWSPRPRPGESASPLRRGLRGIAAGAAALTVAVALLGGYVDPGPADGSAGRATLSGSSGAPGSPGSAGPTDRDQDAGSQDRGPSELRTSAPTGTPTADPTAEPPDAQGGVVTEGPADVIGVASYNIFCCRSEADIAADMRRLTSRDDVDVVGWQETDEVADLFPALEARGWSTRFFADGGQEDAISWRRSEFALVDSRSVLVHRGADAPETPQPFPDRYVTSVVLRHRASGERLTVFDTHLNQYVENLDAPGTWRNNLNATRAKDHLDALTDLWRRADTRWVVGTGDLNFDYRAESRVRPVRGISATVGRVAESSYQALGLRGVPPTHRLSGRWIDYVLADRDALAEGRMAFRSQRALNGYGSDHRPLVVRLELD